MAAAILWLYTHRKAILITFSVILFFVLWFTIERQSDRSVKSKPAQNEQKHEKNPFHLQTSTKIQRKKRKIIFSFLEKSTCFFRFAPTQKNTIILTKTSISA